MEENIEKLIRDNPSLQTFIDGRERALRFLQEQNAILSNQISDISTKFDEVSSQNLILLTSVRNMDKRILELTDELGKSSKDTAISRKASTAGNTPANKRKNSDPSAASAKKDKDSAVEVNRTTSPECMVSDFSENESPLGFGSTLDDNNNRMRTDQETVDGSAYSSSMNLNANDDLDNVGWTTVGNRKRRAGRVSPIQLDRLNGENYSNLSKNLSKLLGNGEFEWMQKIAGAAPKIFCKDAQTEEKAIDFLNEQGIQFNTYADDSKRLKSLISRGLCFGQDSDNIALIRETLTRQGIEGEFTVSVSFPVESSKKELMPTCSTESLFIAALTISSLREFEQLDASVCHFLLLFDGIRF